VNATVDWPYDVDYAGGGDEGLSEGARPGVVVARALEVGGLLNLSHGGILSPVSRLVSRFLRFLRCTDIHDAEKNLTLRTTTRSVNMYRV